MPVHFAKAHVPMQKSHFFAREKAVFFSPDFITANQGRCKLLGVLGPIPCIVPPTRWINSVAHVTNNGNDCTQTPCCCLRKISCLLHSARPEIRTAQGLVLGGAHGLWGEGGRAGFVQFTEGKTPAGFSCWLHLFGSYRKDSARLCPVTHAKRWGW